MRHVILEFIGGAWDGMNLSDGSADPVEAGLARHVAKMTSNCKSGQSVTLPQAYAARGGGCVYRITAHARIGDESLVRLECCDEPCGAVQPEPAKTLVLQFSGGALDGRTLRSDSADLHEALLAAACTCLSAVDGEAESVQILPAVLRRLDAAGQVCGEAAQYRVTARTHGQATITITLAHHARQGDDCRRLS